MQHKVFGIGTLETNCTVLVKDGKCVVVDLAFPSTAVANYILMNNLKVVAILLTHGHFDHCGGVKSFCERMGNVPVYVHEKDVSLCQNAQKWLEDYNGFVPWKMCDDCNPTNTVQEGKLELDGFTFEVFHTPAHTQGSVVYLIDDLLLCGDALFKNSIGRTDFAESVPQQKNATLKKLYNLPFDGKIIPGHGEMSTLASERANNPYFKDLN